GISRQRAQQALGGAVVAEALLTITGGRMAICPWSTRDGLLLTLLDALASHDPSLQVNPLDAGDQRDMATLLQLDGPLD
ncbi:hypothetical protein AB0383_50070, partial [Amycolatopsis sp. NPDC051373]